MGNYIVVVPQVQRQSQALVLVLIYALFIIHIHIQPVMYIPVSVSLSPSKYNILTNKKSSITDQVFKTRNASSKYFTSFLQMYAALHEA